MVERGRRSQQATPGLRRVAQHAGLQRRKVHGQAFRQPVRSATEPLPELRTGRPGEEELARGQEPGFRYRSRPRAGRPGRTRAATRSRRRTTRPAPAAVARPGRRPRCRRDGSSPRGRRPRARSRSPGPRARAGPGPVTAAGPAGAPARPVAIGPERACAGRVPAQTPPGPARGQLHRPRRRGSRPARRSRPAPAPSAPRQAPFVARG